MAGYPSYRLRPEIQQKVRFAYLNLMDTESIRQMRPFDLIFCRNVFIYFSEAAIRQVSEALASVLKPGGYLFTATSEALLRPSGKLKLTPLGTVFAYQRQESFPFQAGGV